MESLKVSELVVHPIKSAKGISLDVMKLGALGPQADRRWMVIDKNNNFVTQRKHPKMCLIETRLSHGQLSILAPGHKEIHVPAGSPAGDGQLINSEVWGSVAGGRDCGNEVALWMTDFIGIECRVIYMTDDYIRLVDPNFAADRQRVSFSDGFPILIATTASLDDFNAKLFQIDPRLQIDMNRFRPNIVISGGKPWEEDDWTSIVIGETEFSLVKPCSRCIMPSINPTTGQKEMAVNQALLKHRRRGTQTYFGQNAIYQSPGSISIGDQVRLIR